MSSAYSTALAGLNANSQAINIVSGNLANLSTTGYKDLHVSFQDLVNANLSGFNSSASISGATIAQTQQRFTQGTLQTTSGPFDAAIQGNGFFVVRATNGQTLFTRQGDFKVDASGDLMTATGEFVQGWNASGGVLNTNGSTSNITLPSTLVAQPSATTEMSISANLNANVAVGAAGSTFNSPIQVFDAQGNSHTLTVTYTETAPNTWSYDVTIPSADLSGGSGGTTTLASGSLTFDGNGRLQSPPASAGTVPITISNLASGASDMNITWKLYDAGANATLTQYNQASANIANDQNGAAPGQLTSMNIGPDGQIVAKFSNGTSQNVAQIALASVLNPDSMQQVNGNNFATTSLTATPVIGLPETGARGQITGGALETSTVDIATEFTNLLQYERGYQANSKVISTEDQVVQQTLSLIANG
ncbi:MAG TPA: flagellar hook protein FlgE [Bryobacteraceae bacterium]|nr:flagellar hook protein FlgE [Bryobacteraceae bacterium]